MADPNQALPDNVSGRFFVDSTCIDCDACRKTAPEFFERSDTGGYSYVKCQPKTPDGEAVCQQAIDECPVDAIGVHE